MVELQPIFKKAYWSLVLFGGIYGALLLCLTNETIQRHALYAHKVPTSFRNHLDHPERVGFAKNQITPFYIPTADGEELHAWHVLPLGLYAKHQKALTTQDSWPSTSYESSLAHRLLTSDPESRVVINFHGNAGHLAQGYRPQTYRSLTSGSENIHVITADYRGFGHSTGVPSEAGLIMDGVALVQYVLDLGIPAERIVLLGQSLGTQVATAVALHFANTASSTQLLPEVAKDLNLPDPSVSSSILHTPRAKPENFASVILVASFPSVSKLLKVYRFGGVLPVLSPLRVYPKIQNFLLKFIKESWDTSARIDALVSSAVSTSSPLYLQILHARDDWDISFRMGEENFDVAKKALISAAGEKNVESESFGDWEDTSIVRRVWKGEVRVEHELVMSGGHNRIVADVPVALAVMRGFGL